MTAATSITADQNQFWAGRRVFVTGATGLVGSWLVKDLLARKAQVFALVRDADPNTEFYRSGDYQRTNIINGRLEDFWTLERAINENEIDTVFHLGAQPIVNVAHRFPLQTFEANIRGSYNLLEACRLHSGLVKRVVVASSDKAYGTPEMLPYTEDMPLQGDYPYEVSKSCTDLLTYTYWHTYGTPTVIARCGNIYGGGDLNWSCIIPDTIRKALQGQPVQLRSDGTFLRDYVYVKDVTKAYMVLAEKLDEPGVKGEGFNFSPERALSVLEIADAVLKQLGRSDLKPVIVNNTKGEIKDQYLDSSKAQRVLGWKPAYSLEQGLKETIEWYQSYLTGSPEVVTA